MSVELVVKLVCDVCGKQKEIIKEPFSDISAVEISDCDIDYPGSWGTCVTYLGDEFATCSKSCNRGINRANELAKKAAYKAFKEGLATEREKLKGKLVTNAEPASSN